MERVLNVKSLGNMNRQFVSLLRSEQDAFKPASGDPQVWDELLGSAELRLTTLDQAFQYSSSPSPSTSTTMTFTSLSSFSNHKNVGNHTTNQHDEALGSQSQSQSSAQEERRAKRKARSRAFPLKTTLRWAYENPGVLVPGVGLVLETLIAYVRQYVLKQTPPALKSRLSKATEHYQPVEMRVEGVDKGTEGIGLSSPTNSSSSSFISKSRETATSIAA